MGLRKEVPHARCSPLCAIKEKLQELWDRAYGCINKINNITPDGDGEFEINAGAGIVVSPDGNGIEISATSVSYTGLDPIVVDNDTLEISAPTVVVQDDLDDYYDKDTMDGLLAGKADTATTLAGYGITDGVTLNTAQDITASKNFDADQFLRGAQGSVRDLCFIDKTNNVRCGMLRANPTTANNQILLTPFQPGSDAFSAANGLVLNNNGSDKYATVPYRAYNSANTTDIVTIGSLAANPSVIHATGNETKIGNLALQGNDYVSGTFQQASILTSRFGASGPQATINCIHDTSDAVNAVIGLKDAQNKTCELRLINYPANNETSLYLITRNGTWHQIASFTD